MANKFSISDELAGIQNILLRNSITKISNVELLQNEEAIRSIYADYADKIAKLGNKIFVANEYLVKNKDSVSYNYFFRLVNDIYVDIKTIYTHSSYIDSLLNINLHNNIKFYNTLEKRILELEDKLDVARLNVNTIVDYNTIYFEGFVSESNVNNYINLNLDKKIGHVTLQPLNIDVHNKKYKVKNVTSRTYPVDNIDGKIKYTTSNLNKFETSYHQDGERDMLQNGLWKEQVICGGVPLLYFTDIDASIRVETQGVVSIVEIEFKQMLPINELDIDLYGEYSTKLLKAIYYNETEQKWKELEKNKISIYDDKFNVIKIKNITKVSTKKIRLYLNQVNYKVLNSTDTNVSDLSSKINKDFSERRYEIKNLNNVDTALPLQPNSYNNTFLYNKLANIIETTSDINQCLQQLIEVFEPQMKIKALDFNRSYQYEIGTWSIEPKEVTYNTKGRFISGSYEHKDSALSSITLDVKQENSNGTSCNWYIESNGKIVPILEFNNYVRVEPINIIPDKNKVKIDEEDVTLKNAKVIKLDFPVSSKEDYIVYKNGVKLDSSVRYVNSTMLVIDNYDNNAKYSVEYKVDIYNTVRCYVCVHDNILYISPRKQLLKRSYPNSVVNSVFMLKHEYNTIFNNLLIVNDSSIEIPVYKERVF